MNERLRELMLEAGYAAPELAGRANKLSELIIEECIKVIDETHGSKKLMRPDPYQRIVSNIQEHFGVEE